MYLLLTKNTKRIDAIDLELKNPDVEQVKSPRHTITVDDFSFRKRLKKELKSIKSVNV